MKKLLIGLLTLASLSAFASLDLAIMNNFDERALSSSDDIKSALISNLENKGFKCSYSLSSIADDETKIQVLSVLRKKSSEAIINADLSQPVITISYPYSTTTKVLFNISTSPDFKDVIEMELLKFEEKVTQVNVGTLINPILETGVQRIYKIKGVCNIN